MRLFTLSQFASTPAVSKVETSEDNDEESKSYDGTKSVPSCFYVLNGTLNTRTSQNYSATGLHSVSKTGLRQMNCIVDLGKDNCLLGTALDTHQTSFDNSLPFP